MSLSGKNNKTSNWHPKVMVIEQRKLEQCQISHPLDAGGGRQNRLIDFVNSIDRNELKLLQSPRGDAIAFGEANVNTRKLAEPFRILHHMNTEKYVLENL